MSRNNLATLFYLSFLEDKALTHASTHDVMYANYSKKKEKKPSDEFLFVNKITIPVLSFLDHLSKDDQVLVCFTT